MAKLLIFDFELAKFSTLKLFFLQLKSVGISSIFSNYLEKMSFEKI